MMLGLENFDSLKIPSKDYPVPSLDYDRVKKGMYYAFFEDGEMQGLEKSRTEFLAFLGRAVHKLTGLNAAALTSAYFEALIQGLALKAELEWKRLYPCSEECFCLVGLGGVARRDLCPNSDLDLLFLYEYKMSSFHEFLIERVLYALWDLKLDVGYSVRSMAELEQDYDKDVTFALSLIDHKYLHGSSILYQAFLKNVEELLRYRAQRGLVWEIAQIVRSRHQRNLGTMHLLEPHIKEGKGGLRDFHSAWWATRALFGVRSVHSWVRLGLISPREERALLRGLNAILSIRTQLHLMTGKRTDKMDLALQECLARAFSANPAYSQASVEWFMRRYYTHARQIEEVSLKVLSSLSCVSLSALKVHRQKARPIEGPFLALGYGIWLKDGSLFDRDPAWLLKVFLLAKETGLPLSYALSRLIRRKRTRVRKGLREDARAASFLVQLFEDFRRIGYVLRGLDETGVLSRAIPEWDRVKNLAQHDIYHAYTADKHLIRTVEALERLAIGQVDSWLQGLQPLLEEERQPAVLIFSALLHDIGKGWGRGHSSTGARIAGRILGRLGLEDAMVEEVVFLVRYHLLMIDYAFKRDLEDPALIERFLNTVRTRDRLRRLYVLSVSDLLAVSPEAMTPWKMGLLEDLFRHSIASFERRQEGKVPLSIPEYAKEARVALESYLTPLPAGDAFLRVVPNPYLLSASPKLSQAHVRLYEVARADGIAIGINGDPSKMLANLDVVARDKPGLFSLLVGGLSYFGFNILWSRIYTTSDGYALDMFKVEHPSLEDLFRDPAYLERFKSLLKDVVALGQDALEELIARKRPAVRLAKAPPKTRPNEVAIDNAISTDYTVIDVKTYDRPFLLYEISCVFVANGINISKANIATIADQVVDTFYVTTPEGKKVDERLAKRLAPELLTAIERGGKDEAGNSA